MKAWPIETSSRSGPRAPHARGPNTGGSRDGWRSPEEVDFLILAACALAGCLGWIVAIFLVRHPVREEVLAVFESALDMLPRPLRLGRF